MDTDNQQNPKKTTSDSKQDTNTQDESSRQKDHMEQFLKNSPEEKQQNKEQFMRTDAESNSFKVPEQKNSHPDQKNVETVPKTGDLSNESISLDHKKTTDYQKRAPLQKSDQNLQKTDKKSAKRRRRRKRKSHAKKQEAINLNDQNQENSNDKSQKIFSSPEVESSQPVSTGEIQQIETFQQEFENLSQISPDNASDSFVTSPETQSNPFVPPVQEESIVDPVSPIPESQSSEQQQRDNDESQLYTPQIQYVQHDPIENNPETTDSVHTITFDPADYAYEPLSPSLNEEPKVDEQSEQSINNENEFQSQNVDPYADNVDFSPQQQTAVEHPNNIPEVSSDFFDSPSKSDDQFLENHSSKGPETPAVEKPDGQIEDFFGLEKDHFFPHETVEKDIFEAKDEVSTAQQPLDQGLEEKQSFLDQLESFLKNAKGKSDSLFSQIKDLGIGGGFFRNCFFLIVFIGVIYGGYAFNIHQIGYKYIQDFLNKPEEKPLEIEVDTGSLDEWGISTGLLFGHNSGSTRDRVESSIQNAFYFGQLQEPVEQGETGITPAYHFGLREDEKIETNRFIQYIDHLRRLQELYQVDVYAMLDQTTSRDSKLFEYLAELQEMQQQSENILNGEILPQIDDFKISYNSLNPDRTRYEQEFFNALSDLAGENADFLLKSFIDISQKQSALRARLAALEQIASYYRTALQRLRIRIETVDKNKDALIQGIRVIDIPGNDLDIIIRER